MKYTIGLVAVLFLSCTSLPSVSQNNMDSELLESEALIEEPLIGSKENLKIQDSEIAISEADLISHYPISNEISSKVTIELEIPFLIPNPVINEYVAAIHERPLATPKEQTIDISEFNSLVLGQLPLLELPDLDEALDEDIKLEIANETNEEVIAIAIIDNPVETSSLTPARTVVSPPSINQAPVVSRQIPAASNQLAEIKAQVAESAPMSFSTPEKNVSEVNTVQGILSVNTSSIPNNTQNSPSIASSNTAIAPSRPSYYSQFALEDEIIIPLQGEGFIFLDSFFLGMNGPEDISLEFVKKEYTGNGELFYFKAPQEGNFRITFLQQDLSAGIQEEIRKDIAVGEDYVANNFYDSEITSEIPNQNLENVNEIQDSFISSESNTKEALLSDEIIVDELLTSLDPLTQEQDIIPDTWTMVQEHFSQGEYDAAYRSLLNIKLEDIDVAYDELLYMKAQIYENADQNKNIEQARSIYVQIMENYPDSIFWNDAEQRYRYIQRNFFRIR
jgi:hypothetical protein